MIRYRLSCAKEHGFDSWFQNAAAFDSLRAAGRVACPVCGDSTVDKVLMAPAVRPARTAASPGPEAPAVRPADRPLGDPQTDLETAIAALRRQIEENSDYVGMNFVAEARRMHAGEAPERAIHGEARPEEARQLLEEGVPVAPLPFLPQRKVN
jgi:hypothetical protein